MRSLTTTKAIRTGKVIATGSFSSIVELQISATGERVAGKVEINSDTKTSINAKAIIQEVEIIKKNHANIVEIKRSVYSAR